MTNNYPYYDLCLSVDGYSVDKDFDNIYLGMDNTLGVKPTASVTAVFTTKDDVNSFYDWWKIETSNGVKPFIITLDYFGQIAPFGVEQISSFNMVRDSSTEEGYKVSFSIKILFDENEINNLPPVAIPLTVYIPTDSKDNYIRFKGEDHEHDPLTFEIETPQGKGEMIGEAPVVFYTPDAGFVGTDCFSFVAKDYYNRSIPAVVTIVVSPDARPEHTVMYNTRSKLSITGNFHYSYDNVVWHRGFGGFLPLGLTIVEDGSFNHGTDEWTALGGATLEVGTLVFTGATGASATQDISNITDGDEFWVDVVIDDLSKGSVIVKLGGTASTPITSEGNYSFKMVAGGSGDLVIESSGRAIVSRVEVYRYTGQDTVYISSDNHKVDGDLGVITHATIIKWGIRTDYSDYFLGQDKMDADGFSVEASAGDCIGENFNSMFEECSVDVLPDIKMPYAKTTDRMFYKSSIQFAIINTTGNIAWVSAKEMFRYAKVERIIGWDTHTVKYFEHLVSDTPNLLCLSALDTRKKLNTSNMLTNTPKLASPNAAAQKVLLKGGTYVAPAGTCGVTISSIKRTGGTETCHIAAGSSTCDSTGTYKITHSAFLGTGTYKWSVVGGTVTGGAGTDTVTIKVSSGKEVYLKVSCVITDGGGKVNSGPYSFKHSRTSDILKLYLPKSYKQIVLADFIASHNPTATKIVVYNNLLNCSVRTGALDAKWDVTLENNGELQGFVKGRTNTNATANYGLYIDKPITLINNGWIRGAGGYGGKGHAGKDDVHVTYKNHGEKYYWRKGSTTRDEWYWMVSTYAGRVHVTWSTPTNRDNMVAIRNGDKGMNGKYYKSWTGPFVHGKYTYTRGRSHGAVDATNTVYGVKCRERIDTPRKGGLGGLGGTGIGYNTPNAVGKKGSPSTPTGGHSGYTGGTGGSWGKTGNRGGGNGGTGYIGCPAIKGKATLTAKSKTGNVSGSIT